MKRLYHDLVEHRWGEPADLIVFEGSRAAVAGALEQVHVAIWDAGGDCDVTSFMTLGMSERPMPEADYRTELTLGVRGTLTSKVRRQLPVLLANLSEYPFRWRRRLDWWERLVDPGAIPGFPGCSELLLAPMFGDSEFTHFPAPDDDVKVLSVHILKDHGRQAFLDHWERTGVDLFSPRKDAPGSTGRSRAARARRKP
jgi:hypothetical protein